MFVALKVKRMQYKHYRWLCKMSIATIDAWFWCAHVESMKATLNQRQLRETERCPRSNCLRMDWRSSTDCCHGNSAGRSWALDQGKSACLAAFVASRKISLRVWFVVKSLRQILLRKKSQKYHEIVMVFGKWMIDHQGVGILVRRNLWSVFLLNRLRFRFWQFSRNLVFFYGILHVFKLLLKLTLTFFVLRTPLRASLRGFQFCCMKQHQRPSEASMIGSQVPFWKYFFSLKPTMKLHSCIEYMIETSMSRCKSWSSFLYKTIKVLKSNSFPVAFGWRFIYAASTAAAAFGFPCCGCCGNVERSPNQSPEKCTNPWATGLPCGSFIFWWCILMLEVVLNCTYCWKQWKWTMFWLEKFSTSSFNMFQPCLGWHFSHSNFHNASETRGLEDLLPHLKKMNSFHSSNSI